MTVRQFDLADRTHCPFCERAIGRDEITCDRYGCEPSVEKVLEKLGEENLYLHTNYKGRMQLYHDVYGNSERDERVWSDRKDKRVIALLERLGVEQK